MKLKKKNVTKQDINSLVSFKFLSIYKRMNNKLFEKETTKVLPFSFVVDVWYDLP